MNTWPILASVTPALFLGIIFGTYMFHRLSFEDEKAATFKQKQIAVQELDRVDTSQELRTKQERDEDQSLDGEEESDEARGREPKTLVDEDENEEIDDSVIERTIRQLNEYDERLHLVTFAATEQEADFILKYVNASRYLINLDASDLADHVVTVEYKKRRSASCPPSAR